MDKLTGDVLIPTETNGNQEGRKVLLLGFRWFPLAYIGGPSVCGVGFRWFPLGQTAFPT
jgi:hypothetical protein